MKQLHAIAGEPLADSGIHYIDEQLQGLAHSVSNRRHVRVLDVTDKTIDKVRETFDFMGLQETEESPMEEPNGEPLPSGRQAAELTATL